MKLDLSNDSSNDCLWKNYHWNWNSMMVGGNIKYHTRTITTTISIWKTGKGEFETGIALGLVLL